MMDGEFIGPALFALGMLVGIGAVIVALVWYVGGF